MTKRRLSIRRALPRVVKARKSRQAGNLSTERLVTVRVMPGINSMPGIAFSRSWCDCQNAGPLFACIRLRSATGLRITQRSGHVNTPHHTMPAKKTLPTTRAKTATKPSPRRPPIELSESERGCALRWQVAHLLLNDAVGERVTFEDLGKMLAQFLPKGRGAYHKAIVYRMESGERSIHLDDILALCDLCRKHGLEIDPGWLAFGDRSAAPEPMTSLVSRSRRVR